MTDGWGELLGRGDKLGAGVGGKVGHPQNSQEHSYLSSTSSHCSCGYKWIISEHLEPKHSARHWSSEGAGVYVGKIVLVGIGVKEGDVLGALE